ncbi:MAG: hypothetical protein L0Y54_20310 [Sporichthyaceae bacterium]|nr:hypothetical protein [Sporichthyaceae bacterium]
MTTAVVSGAGFGLGLALFLLGLVPQRRTMLSVLAELDAGRSTSSRHAVPLLASSRLGRRLEKVELVVGERIAYELLARGWLGASSLRTDLALLGYDPGRFMASKVAWALAAFAAIPLLAALLPLLGLPGIFSLWVGLMWAAIVFVLPDLQVRKLAAKRRRDFRTVIGTYLDLVAMRVASGSGVAEALTDAATIGEGWTFARLRATLSGGRTDGLSPARSLGRLGSELDVPELIDLASQLTLVDTAGAQAETSLRAKAGSLRERQLSDAHGKANERSQHMLIAQVLLGVGFLILIGYPAVSKVLLL